MNAQKQKPQDWGELIASQDPPWQPMVRTELAMLKRSHRTEEEVEFIRRAILAGGTLYDATCTIRDFPGMAGIMEKMLDAGATWPTAQKVNAWTLYRAAHDKTNPQQKDIFSTEQAAQATTAEAAELPAGISAIIEQAIPTANAGASEIAREAAAEAFEGWLDAVRDTVAEALAEWQDSMKESIREAAREAIKEWHEADSV